jgi:enoyl-CoA hydratase
MPFRHLEIEREAAVATLWLNRPEKMNALSADMWEDIPRAIGELGDDSEVRAVVIAGRGASFTVGIDLELLRSLFPSGESEAQRNQQFYQTVRRLQASMSAIAGCRKPVVAGIHGYCLGAGVDLITACDIRLAASDAVFSVRETRLAMVADVGTLQRLPRLLSPGHTAELVYTGKDIDSSRAKAIGLVNEVYPDQEATLKASRELAGEIAANSPLVVQGIKQVLSATAGRSVEESLDYVALWNSAFLQSRDLGEALAAHFEKRPPRFEGI